MQNNPTDPKRAPIVASINSLQGKFMQSENCVEMANYVLNRFYSIIRLTSGMATEHFGSVTVQQGIITMYINIGFDIYRS